MPDKAVAGAAPTTTLSSAINASAVQFSVVDATGYPSGKPFVVFMGAKYQGETGTPEKILVGSRTGSLFQDCTRGYDGTTAASHSVGEPVRHVLDAIAVQEFIDHIYNVALDQHTQYLNTARHDLSARHTIGSVIPAAVPVSIDPGDSQLGGTANSVARSDHQHAMDPWATSGQIAASAVGDAAAAGSLAAYARADHKHARESVTTIANAVLPAGVIVPYAAPGNVAPTGWLLCTGQSVSRATYPALWTVLGLTYTAVNDGTTFQVPDLRGRIPLGKDSMGGSSANRVTAAQADTEGQAAGAETHLLTATEMPVHTHIQNSHTHGVNDPGHKHTLGGGIGGAIFAHLNASALFGSVAGPVEKITFAIMDNASTGISIQSTTPTNQNAGGSTAHNNMVPYLTVNYLIKAH